MIMRPCQQEAVDEVYEHLRTKDTTPCVVLPTGTGKSLCLARIASDAVTLWGGASSSSPMSRSCWSRTPKRCGDSAPN